jgi:hypothetical protein
MLVKFLKEAKIDDAILRETSIEMLYKELEYLNEVQLLIVSSYLSISKRYINKDFLIKLAKRVALMYKSGSLQEKYLFGMLSNLSEI